MSTSDIFDAIKAALEHCAPLGLDRSALKELAKMHGVAYSGKALRAIIKEGADRELWVSGPNVTILPLGSAPVAPSPEVAPEVAPEVTVQRRERGLSIADLLNGIQEGVADPFYAQDPELRGLAIEATPCFGWFRNGNSECRACPLASICAETLMASVSSTASLLQDDLERRIREAQRERELALNADLNAGEELSVAKDLQEADQENLLKGLRTIPMPFQAVCSASCGAPISEGETCYNIPGKGGFHRDCAIAALKDAPLQGGDL